MTCKYEYFFITAKKGEKIGKIVSRSTLKAAREERKTLRDKYGQTVSKIAKRKKK